MRSTNIFLILSTISGLLWSGEGASYNGKNKYDAAAILDESDGSWSYGFGFAAFPRQLVWPDIVNLTEDPGSMFYAFYNREDQNDVVHRILSHPKTQKELEKINSFEAHTEFEKDPFGVNTAEKYKRIIMRFTSIELGYDDVTVPLIFKVDSGNPIGPALRMTMVSTAIGHHRGQQLNKSYNVLVMGTIVN